MILETLFSDKCDIAINESVQVRCVKISLDQKKKGLIMQMHEQIMMVDGQEQPISRTYQYRKVSVLRIFPIIVHHLVFTSRVNFQTKKC